MCCVGRGYCGFNCVSHCLVLQTMVRFSSAELSARANTAMGRPAVIRRYQLLQRHLCHASLSTWESHVLPHCKAFLLPYPAPKKIRLRAVVTLQSSNLSAVLVLPRAAESQRRLPLEAQGHRHQQGESFRQKCNLCLLFNFQECQHSAFFLNFPALGVMGLQDNF